MDHLLRFLRVAFASALESRQRRVIAYLQAENHVLRQQLGDRRILFTDPQRIRLAKRAKEFGRKALQELGTIVEADTLLAWYRKLVAHEYTAKRRTQGRPRTHEEIEQLVVEMATSNPTWGYTRICGRLKHLGIEVGRTTVSRILVRNGVNPVPHRGTRWADFLKAHLGHLFAADFFTVEVLAAVRLVRYHVLFFIDIATRRVHVGGVVHEPSGFWMKQQVLDLTDPVDGFLGDAKYLILDRDPVFSKMATADPSEVVSVSAACFASTIAMPRRPRWAGPVAAPARPESGEG